MEYPLQFTKVFTFRRSSNDAPVTLVEFIEHLFSPVQAILPLCRSSRVLSVPLVSAINRAFALSTRIRYRSRPVQLTRAAAPPLRMLCVRKDARPALSPARRSPFKSVSRRASLLKTLNRHDQRDSFRLPGVFLLQRSSLLVLFE